MTVTTERKREITAKFGANERDTGNTKVQVALLTERINELPTICGARARITIPDAAC